MTTPPPPVATLVAAALATPSPNMPSLSWTVLFAWSGCHTRLELGSGLGSGSGLGVRGGVEVGVGLRS